MKLKNGMASARMNDKTVIPMVDDLKYCSVSMMIKEGAVSNAYSQVPQCVKLLLCKCSESRRIRTKTWMYTVNHRISIQMIPDHIQIWQRRGPRASRS